MGPLGFRNTYSWGRHIELSFSWFEVSRRAINGLGEIRTLGYRVSLDDGEPKERRGERRERRSRVEDKTNAA